MKCGFCLIQVLQAQEADSGVQPAMPTQPHPRQRRAATRHWSSVHGRWRRTLVITLVLTLVFQKLATPRARLRSSMSPRHCFFGRVEASGR